VANQGWLSDLGISFPDVEHVGMVGVVPTYRSKFSKHLFTQPQLLAVPCLMRYEDWTFREAEVRLREHTELREALAWPISRHRHGSRPVPSTVPSNSTIQWHRAYFRTV